MAQVLLNGIIVGGIYALISIGFNLIYSCVRFYHLAYGTLAVFGSYITYVLSVRLHWDFSWSVLVSAIVFGLLGMLFWLGLYAPLKKRKASDVAMLVASFGLLIVLQNLIALLFGNAAKSISVTNEIVAGYSWQGLFITLNQIIILVATVVMVLLFESLMRFTKLGTAIRAVGQNRELARTVGIQSGKIILATFFLATFVSVIGASLIALETGLRPTYGLSLILKVIIACIIGGMGRVQGALAGGLILGIAENLGIYWFGAIWQDTTAFILLILFLLLRPKGLFSS